MNINLVTIPLKNKYLSRNLNTRVIRWSAKGFMRDIHWKDEQHFEEGYLYENVCTIAGRVRTLLVNETLPTINLCELSYSGSREHNGYSPEEIGHLGQKLKDIHEDSDLTVVLGASHATGWILYHLAGNVVRADAHGDEVLDCDFITGYNYAAIAIYSGLKTDADISQFEADFPGEIFDIDFNAFPKAYGIVESDGMFGNLSASQLYKRLRRDMPRAVGFFEYYPSDDTERTGETIIVRSICTLVRAQME